MAALVWLVMAVASVMYLIGGRLEGSGMPHKSQYKRATIQQGKKHASEQEKKKKLKPPPPPKAKRAPRSMEY